MDIDKAIKKQKKSPNCNFAIDNPISMMYYSILHNHGEICLGIDLV